MVTPPSRASSARRAREFVAPAVDLLQRAVHLRAPAARALEHAALALGALYGAEAESETEAEANSGLKRALVEVGRALEALDEAPEGEVAEPGVREGLAHALAFLYPLASGERRRKDVLLPGAVNSMDRERLQALLEERRKTALEFAGAEHREAGERVPIEVDVGLLSDSNFYTGVSQDISRGGVFVATEQPLPAGSAVTLYFALGGERLLRAEGVVRWSRSPEAGLVAGMGVGFSSLGEDDRRAIAEYCSNRPPLFHEE